MGFYYQSESSGSPRLPGSDTVRLRAALLKLLTDDPFVMRSTPVWLDELEQTLRRPVPVTGAAGPESLRAVVDTCLSEPFGLRALEHAVATVTGHPETARALPQLADEWQALELLPDADWDILRALLGDLEPPALSALGRRAAGGRINGLPGHCTTA